MLCVLEHNSTDVIRRELLDKGALRLLLDVVTHAID